AMAHAAWKAAISTGTASLKLNRDPLGSHFLNDSADGFGQKFLNCRVGSPPSNSDTSSPAAAAASTTMGTSRSRSSVNSSSSSACSLISSSSSNSVLMEARMAPLRAGPSLRSLIVVQYFSSALSTLSVSAGESLVNSEKVDQCLAMAGLA